MNDAKQYVYPVSFTNIHAVCKITDVSYGLLYYMDNGGYRPAVYSKLMTAFNHLKSQSLYYKEGDNYYPCPTVNTGNTRVEMLTENYVMEEYATFHSGTTAVLTMADPNAADGFPYVGTTNTVASITRGYDGQSMITVQGNLTLGNITMEGGTSGGKSANTNGGVFHVANGGSLTMGSGATIRNSNTTASGAGVYLEEGSKMYLSGAPSFRDNVSTGTVMETGSTNGGAARQDIYIAGYPDSQAESLVVTGNLTGPEGAIWVWAENGEHYQENKQFAAVKDGVTVNNDTYKVFRNAQTDRNTTGRTRTTDDGILLGGKGSGQKIIWGDSVEITFKKVDGFGNGLGNAVFAVYEDFACTKPVTITVNEMAASNVSSASEEAGSVKIGDVVFKVPIGEYYMKETSAPTGFTENTNVYKIAVEGEDDYRIKRMSNATTVEENGPDIAKYGILNISTSQREVILKKIDETFTPLKDAQFQILRYDRTLVSSTDINGNTTTTFRSGSNGVYFIDDLPFGTYYIHETNTPAGYKTLDGTANWFILTVKAEGVSAKRLSETP